MKISLILGIVIMLVNASSVSAQEIATTETGKRFLLHPNGKWEEMKTAGVPDTTGYDFLIEKAFTDVQSTPFQVKGIIVGFGNTSGSFVDQMNIFYSYIIEYPFRTKSDHFTIFVRRDSPDAKRINELLRDGRKHKIVVEVRHRSKKEIFDAWMKGTTPELAHDQEINVQYDSRSVLLTKILLVDSWGFKD